VLQRGCLRGRVVDPTSKFFFLFCRASDFGVESPTTSHPTDPTLATIISSPAHLLGWTDRTIMKGKTGRREDAASSRKRKLADLEDDFPEDKEAASPEQQADQAEDGIEAAMPKKKKRQRGGKKAKKADEERSHGPRFTIFVGK
jgi:hypothetical protein